MASLVYVTVEFPDAESAVAARVSGVTLHSTRVIPDDETIVVFRGTVDGECSEVAVGCDCDHGLHRVIDDGAGCLHPGCLCPGYFTGLDS